MKNRLLICLCSLFCVQACAASSKVDTFVTNTGKNIQLHMIKHATFYLNIDGYIIYFDPVSDYADFSSYPKADAIIITHDHYDHLDMKAIHLLKKKKTLFITNGTAADTLKKKKIEKNVIRMKNGDHYDAKIFQVEAVPAYNTTRPEFHPKGRDNGYILSIDNHRYYIAGDCENMPEMSNYKNIDVAFLPVNQPYTMTINQVVHAAKMICPKVIYPIHMGNTDANELEIKLKEVPNCEIRMRDM